MNKNIYTYIQLGGIRLPLNVCISKIKESHSYELSPFENVCKYSFAEKCEDETDDSKLFFYGKFKTYLQMKFIAETIYDFVDFESMDFVGYATKIISRDKKVFVENLVSSDIINIEEMVNAYQEILYYIAKVKSEWIEDMHKYFDIFYEYPTKDLPKSDFDYTKTNIYKKHKENLSAPMCLIDSQILIEDNSVVFQENIGKATYDFSWREKEFKRLYLKKKTDFDNFSESAKSAMMDELRDSDKK